MVAPLTQHIVLDIVQSIAPMVAPQTHNIVLNIVLTEHRLQHSKMDATKPSNTGCSEREYSTNAGGKHQAR